MPSLCDHCAHAKISCTVLPADMGVTNLRIFCGAGHYDAREHEDLPQARASCADFSLYKPKEEAES